MRAHPPCQRAAPCGGFSLVEIALVLAIGVVLLSGAALASKQALGLYRESLQSSELHMRAARATERCVRALRGAGLATLAPPPVAPLGGALLDYNVQTGFAGEVAQWSAVQRLALELEQGELDNGLDDDGDGLVDEGQIVWSEAGRRAVLARGVAELGAGELPNGLDDDLDGLVDEAGLSFDLANGGLRVSITLERPGPGGTRVREARSATVFLRN